MKILVSVWFLGWTFIYFLCPFSIALNNSSVEKRTALIIMQSK